MRLPATVPITTQARALPAPEQESFPAALPLRVAGLGVVGMAVLALSLFVETHQAAAVVAGAILLLVGAWTLASLRIWWSPALLAGISSAILASTVSLLAIQPSPQVAPAVALTFLVAVTLRWVATWLESGRPSQSLQRTTVLLAIALTVTAAGSGLDFAWPGDRSAAPLFIVGSALAAGTGHQRVPRDPLTYLLVTFGFALAFESSRDLAAWLGLAVAAVSAFGARSGRPVSHAPSELTGGLAAPLTGESLPLWSGLAALVVACGLALAFGGAALTLTVAAAASVAVSLHGASISADLRSAQRRIAQLEHGHQILTERSKLDALTGLPNRAAMDARLREEVERALRYQQPLAVCFIDIDHFKQINDERGHAAGDAVLRDVAHAIRSHARAVDFVARYGGEEFVVLAPGTWSGDGLIFGERLREAITANARAVDGVEISVSIGIAGVPEHAATSADVLARADQALYRAKRAGRARCELFTFDWQPAPRAPSAPVP